MGVLITRKIKLSLQKCHFCFYMILFLLEHLKSGITVEENTHLIHFCRNLASLKLLTMIISLPVSNSAKRIYCAEEGGLKPSLLVGNSVMGGTWVGPGTCPDTFPCKRLILTFWWPSLWWLTSRINPTCPLSFFSWSGLFSGVFLGFHSKSALNIHPYLFIIFLLINYSKKKVGLRLKLCEGGGP